MKNQFLYIILLFALVSCQDNVKFNNPSFQGMKDNVFWRAIDSRAVLVANGSLSIEGYTNNEKVTLKTSSKNKGTYVLGTGTSNTATYVLTDSKITFAAGLGIGEGQVVITEYDVVNKTVSGNFKFNAVNTIDNPLAAQVLNFQQGVFYKVPVGL